MEAPAGVVEAARRCLIFLVPATLIFHNYWAIDPTQVREVTNQTNHFFKNLTIMSALVLIMGMGSGPLSLPGGKNKKH